MRAWVSSAWRIAEGRDGCRLAMGVPCIKLRGSPGRGFTVYQYSIYMQMNQGGEDEQCDQTRMLRGLAVWATKQGAGKLTISGASPERGYPIPAIIKKPVHVCKKIWMPGVGGQKVERFDERCDTPSIDHRYKSFTRDCCI